MIGLANVVRNNNRNTTIMIDLIKAKKNRFFLIKNNTLIKFIEPTEKQRSPKLSDETPLLFKKVY